MSLFGSTFGQPAQQQQQQQQQGGGGGGGLFGQPQQQQPQQSGGGLFGAPTTQQSGGGGLLGGNSQQGFGGGLFGQQQQQPQQQQQGGGLFGSQQAAGGGGGGGGMFGQPQQAQGGGGLFGSQQQQPQQQQQQQQGGGGGGGLFGGQQQQQPQGGGGGLFGQPQQNQPQPQQQQQSGSLFGQPQQSQQNQGMGMGMGTNAYGNQNQFGQQNQYGQQAQFAQQGQGSVMMQSQQQQANVVMEKMQRIKNAWDPTHPDYAFRCYFHNEVGEANASIYQKPPNEDSAAFEKAWAERPNKGCVPVLANGFSDLARRVKSQEDQVNNYRVGLHKIQDRLTYLQNRHNLVITIKLEDCRRRHTALSRRALSLAAKVQVLKNRGYALQPDEEALKKRLETLAKRVTDPAVSGGISEIWARMTTVREQARLMEESVGKVEIVWDEKQLQTAGKLLQGNAAGLEYLSKEVKEIEKDFQKWEEETKTFPRGGGL